MLPFADWLFLVTRVHPLDHATICRTEPEVECKCKLMFPHCWSVKHLLMDNDTYVYKEEYFFNEESYQKKPLVYFVNILVYLGGGVPSAKANQKRFKCLIGVPLLMRISLRRIFVFTLVSLKFPPFFMLVFPFFWCLSG